MAVILTVTATPSTFASGAFPLSTFQSGPAYRTTVTPSQASTSSTFGGFCALLTTNDDGGLWLADHRVSLFSDAGGGTLVGESASLTWSISQPIVITIHLAVGVNASSIVVSGATTGNGTTNFTAAGTFFTASTLGVGQFSAAGTFALPGTISNVDDTLGISRTAALSVTVGAAVVATRTLERSAAVSLAVGAASEATVPGGPVERTAALSVAVGAASVATRVLERSTAVSVAVDATTLATVPGSTAFGPGVQTSGLWTFGHSELVCTTPGGYLPGGTVDMDGRTPTAIDTQASGSMFYVAVARPVATVDKTVTDNKGNTFTSLLTGDYGGVSNWESQILVCVGGDGGTDHEITANGIVNDELTLAFDEIKTCAYLADHGTSFTPDGQTQISPTGIDLKGPGWVYVDWFGEGPVSGAEGADWTVTAVDEGSTVGSQWQVVDSRVKNHTDGWIQWKRWRRFYAAATTGVRLQLAALTPAQGARWYAAAFMEVNVTEATAALTIAVGAAVAATRTLQRSAAATIAAAASSAAVAVRVRSAAVELAMGANAAAAPVRERAAALSVAVGATSAATIAVPGVIERSAALAVAVGASCVATRVIERSAAMSTAVGAVTSATGGSDVDPWTTVENTIYGWVLAGSGLVEGRIIWGRDSAKNGPMPSGTYISMRVMELGRVSSDWLRSREVNGVIEHRIEGTRHPTLELTCFSGEPFGAGRAQVILDRVLASIKLPSVAALLAAGNVGVGMRERVRVVDGARSGMFDPRAIVEVGLHLAFEMVDPVAGAAIERVETTGPDGTVTWVPEAP